MNYIYKGTGSIPFGYELTSNPFILKAIPEQVNALEEAYTFLEQGHSYQRVCDWIKTKTGRYISRALLVKKHRQHQKGIDTRRSILPGTFNEDDN